MNDIKMFAKNEKEFDILIQTIRICSQDIGMEFGIEKCAMFIIRSGKRQITEGIRLSNQERVKRKGNLQILGYIGIGHNPTSRDERRK